MYILFNMELEELNIVQISKTLKIIINLFKYINNSVVT